MEFFGRIESINLSREGVSQRGIAYQIQEVEVKGSEHVAFSCYGTRDHLEKAGIMVGAEGKFVLKTSCSEYQGRHYNRIELIDAYRDFMPLGGRQPKTEQKAPEAEAAQQVGKAEPAAEQKAPAEANDDLPF